VLKHKIMEYMLLREESRQLTGRVEIHDAYLGGEIQGGKAGRSSVRHVPSIPIQEVRASQLRSGTVPLQPAL